MKHEDVPPAVDLIFSGRASPHLEVCSQSSYISGYMRICIFFVTSITSLLVETILDLCCFSLEIFIFLLHGMGFYGKHVKYNKSDKKCVHLLKLSR